MQERTSESTDQAGAGKPQRRQYEPPVLRTYGNVRDLTLTQPAGPNFDGGGGANIYAS